MLCSETHVLRLRLTMAPEEDFSAMAQFWFLSALNGFRCSRCSERPRLAVTFTIASVTTLGEKKAIDTMPLVIPLAFGPPKGKLASCVTCTTILDQPCVRSLANWTDDAGLAFAELPAAADTAPQAVHWFHQPHQRSLFSRLVWFGMMIMMDWRRTLGEFMNCLHQRLLSFNSFMCLV